MSVPRSCSADGVQAGCDQEIDKANGNKNVVDLCMRVKKSFLIFLFKLILMFLWKKKGCGN